MDFKNHIETAWQSTLKFLGPLILLTLAQLLVSTFSLGILAPVTLAGYMRSLLLALRHGREPELKDLFSETRLFLPLIGFGLLVMIALTIGFTIFILPGIVMTICLVFGTLYMVPLMTDQRLGLIDALKGSWEMATQEPWTDQIIITVLYLALVSLGGTVVVAILFTQPLATLLVLSVYEARLQKRRGLSTTPPVPPIPPALQK
jgi:ABC-type multidrug transport system permease subunit